MESKTPKFDKLLDKVLKDLQPHERTCEWAGKTPYCSTKFFVTDEDIKFYNKLRVPPAKLCPTCRRLKRFSHGLVLHFYRMKCDVPGHNEMILSISTPGLPFKIYDWDYYRTYEWNPFSYAVEPDTRRPLLDIFWEMRKAVPQYAIVRHPSNIESEYTIGGKNLKHAYLVSGGWNSERVYYSVGLHNVEDSSDSYFLDNARQCYENVLSKSINNGDYIYFSNDCYSSQFLFDCKNCHDCFGCVNLRSKSYCFFNEQLSKDEYERKMAAINLGDRRELKKWERKFWEFIKSQPIQSTRIEKSVNCIGTHVLESKNCYGVYNAEKSENLRYADITIGNSDSMDYATSGGSELMYQTVGVGSQCSNVKFSRASKIVRDSEFLINCTNVKNCFACIGLENQEYCVFNKKYTPDEYFKIVDDLKSAMMERGEYGEFLPIKFSHYSYNDSFAEIVFPLTPDQIESIGGVWHDRALEDKEIGNLQLVESKDIPTDIKSVNSEVLKKAFTCEITGRPFRVVSDELDFYRRKNLPLPSVHPHERIRKRDEIARYRLFDENCQNCGIEIKSMYRKEEGFKPYCEKCYQAKVV